jgi:hypothetical protein
MFSQQNSSGSGYTTTVALLAVAFIFSPAALVASRPIGYVSASLAIACSGLCLALAWIKWKKRAA